MKICALVTNIFKTGGIAQYNYHLLKAIAQHEQIKELIVLTRDNPGNRINQKALPYKILGFYPSKFLFALKAIFIFQINKSFDLLFCGHILLMPLAALLSKIYKVPIWLQIHGIEVWKKPSQFSRWLTKHATFVTSVSRYTRDQFCYQFGHDFHDVKVLPNTVGDQFHPGMKRDDLLNKYNLHRKKILLTVSRLAPTERYKGIDKIIVILPMLLQKFPDLCYVIAGNGEDKVFLNNLAKNYDVEKQVVFLDNISDEELPYIYQLADVYVMPSLGEGFGIVFVEAACCGLSVIAGNKDGSIDALQEGRLGRLVDPNDSTSIIQSITLALQEEWTGTVENSCVFKKENFNQHCHVLLEKLLLLPSNGVKYNGKD